MFSLSMLQLSHFKYLFPLWYKLLGIDLLPSKSSTCCLINNWSICVKYSNPGGQSVVTPTGAGIHPPGWTETAPIQTTVTRVNINHGQAILKHTPI